MFKQESTAGPIRDSDATPNSLGYKILFKHGNLLVDLENLDDSDDLSIGIRQDPKSFEAILDTLR